MKSCLAWFVIIFCFGLVIQGLTEWPWITVPALGLGILVWYLKWKQHQMGQADEAEETARIKAENDQYDLGYAHGFQDGHTFNPDDDPTDPDN